jgi:drug/metabolite transporter (DMT)-like permease
VFAALLCTVLFSISAICGHRSARLIGGMEANFWRLTTAVFALGIWSFSFGIGLSGVTLPWFLLSGVLGIGIGDMAYFQALPRLGPRLSVLMVHCLTAPCAACLEWLWLGTALSWKQILLGLTALGGVGVALSSGEHFGSNRRRSLGGILFCLVGALGVGSGAVVSRKAYTVAHLAGESIDGGNAGFQRVVGGLVLAGVGLLIAKRQVFRVQAGAPRELPLEVSKRKWRGVWFWVLANGIAGQTVGVSCMQWALETTPTGIVLAIIATTPIVVIPFAMVFEGERPTRRSVLGAVIAVASIAGLILVG